MKQVIPDPLYLPGTQAIETEKWHQTQVVPQVADTDYGGGVYHGKYFALYNQARDTFMADLGVSYRSLMNLGMNLSVAELHTRFFKPVFYGEDIRVHTRISWMRTRSLGVIQKMMAIDPAAGNPEAGEPILKNEVDLNLVCTNDKAAAVPLPDQLTRAILDFYDR